MTAPITRDALLEAYVSGRKAGYDAARRGELLAPFDQGEGDPELTLAEVLERFDAAGPSDVLKLGKLEPAEVLRALLGAMDRGQYIFRVNHPDGWVANVLTTHGTAAVSADGNGRTSFNITQPPIHKGTLDIGEQVRITQARHIEEGKGWWTQTGAQYGRWYL